MKHDLIVNSDKLGCTVSRMATCSPSRMPYVSRTLGVAGKTLYGHDDVSCVPSAESSAIPVLAQVDALPGSEVKPPVSDGNIDGCPHEGTLTKHVRNQQTASMAASEETHESLGVQVASESLHGVGFASQYRFCDLDPENLNDH